MHHFSDNDANKNQEMEDTHLLSNFLTEVLVVALHELALAVKVQALLQVLLPPHIQADLRGIVHTQYHLDVANSRAFL